MINQADVIRLFNYDPLTGVVTRKLNGKIVGSTHSCGYLAVRINYKAYYIHRIIWLLIHGKFPKNVSGVPGVYKNRKGFWAVQIKVNYKMIYLGQFEDFKKAVEVRKLAEIKHNFRPNHGRVGVLI